MDCVSDAHRKMVVYTARTVPKRRDRLSDVEIYTTTLPLAKAYEIFAWEKSISGCAAMNFFKMSCLFCSSLVGRPICF